METYWSFLAGDGRRISCLKYLVLANMLTGSKINPFEGQVCIPLDIAIDHVHSNLLCWEFKEFNLKYIIVLLRCEGDKAV